MKKIFLATPISCFVDPNEYEALRQSVSNLAGELRKNFEVYCEIERITDADDYDSPEVSVLKDFGKINEADIFMLVHLRKCQTSALMELGYAFAQSKEIVLIGSKENLPYMALGLNVPGHPMSLIDVEQLDDVSIQRICHTAGAMEDKRELENVNRLDRIRGCMIGGAVGDALGFAIEFWQERQIFGKYGQGGIEDYELDPVTGCALISDDTQMSLFTACGLINGEFSGRCRGVMEKPRNYVLTAYEDWLKTQSEEYRALPAREEGCEVWNTWLMDIPDLYSRRAPGNTCLSALEYKDQYPVQDMDYVSTRINHSKGCGGIMRTAPVALIYGDKDPVLTDMEAAQIAALTHGHPLGFLPSAVLNHILSLIVYGDGSKGLKEIITESRDAVCKQFAETEYIDDLRQIITRAIELSENDDNDLDNIHKLGGGWVAEETLAIAIYCSLRHEYEFSEGIITAVNHNGDSDSTAAVTGNILGAVCGYKDIDDKWKQDLELRDVILEMSDDIYNIHSINGNAPNSEWIRKYEHMRHI